jgi:hypothetical protein
MSDFWDRQSSYHLSRCFPSTHREELDPEAHEHGTRSMLLPCTLLSCFHLLHALDLPLSSPLAFCLKEDPLAVHLRCWMGSG